MAQQIALVFKASPQVGGGHAMRCLTLAGALRAEGAQVVVMADTGTVAALPDLAGRVDRIEEIAKLDAASVRAAMPEGCDAVVVDCYELAAPFETGLRGWASTVAVIDDLADRPHDCDLLVDQTHGRAACDYDGLVPGDAWRLTGSAYALVADGFLRRRPAALAQRRCGTLGRRIFASAGLTDPLGILGLVLEGLRTVCPNTAVDIVIGGQAPHLAALRAATAALGERVRLHVDVAPDQVAELMADAYFAVGASGTTSWERCVLGLPAIVVVGGDNQRKVAAGLAAAGAIRLLGRAAELSPDTLAAALQEWCYDPAAVAAASLAAARLCDGLGARRVAGALSALANSAAGLWLRPATVADAKLLYAWQAHPTTRRYFRNPAVPSWDEHVAWLASKLADPETLLCLAMVGNDPAGIVRLDPEDEAGAREVSILIDPDRRGQGLGTLALRALDRLCPCGRKVAAVNTANVASAGAFLKAGYIRVAEETYAKDQEK